jgi:hypothetical protein
MIREGLYPLVLHCVTTHQAKFILQLQIHLKLKLHQITRDENICIFVELSKKRSIDRVSPPGKASAVSRLTCQGPGGQSVANNGDLRSHANSPASSEPCRRLPFAFALFAAAVATGGAAQPAQPMVALGQSQGTVAGRHR